MDNIVIFEANAPGTGVSYIRNLVMPKAEGKYVFHLDSDDEFLDKCMEKVVDGMEKSGADVGSFTAEVQTSHGSLWLWLDENPAEGIKVYEKGDPRIGKSFCLSGITLWCRCYRRDFLTENKFMFDESTVLGEDVLFNIETTAKAEKVCVFPGVCGYRYYHGQGMLMKHISLEGAVKFLDMVEERVCKNGLSLNNFMWYTIFLVKRSFVDIHRDGKIPPSIQLSIKQLIPLFHKLTPPEMNCKFRQKEADMIYMKVKEMFDSVLR